MNDPQTVPIKIIMVGSIGVGKTSLVAKYATGKIPGKKESTKNASYVNKIKTINGIKFEIKLWDTAGQEKYKSLTKLFIKDAKIAILVYSINNEQSFNDLDNWFNFVKNTIDESVLYGVAANKFDLANEDTIPDEKGQKYAESIGADWTTTSAIIDGKGIDDFVEKLFIKYYNLNFNLSHTGSSSITLSSEKTKVEKKGCCGGSQEVVVDKNNKNKNKNPNKHKKK